MRLDRVQIINFRSIKDITLKLDPRCRVLVGITEAGKTNILRALSLLNPNIQPTNDDVREDSPNENQSAVSRVMFVFSLDSDDRNNILDQLVGKIISPESEPPILTVGTNLFSLPGLCDLTTEGLYSIHIGNKVRNATTWSYPNRRIAPGWYIPSPACPDGFTITDDSGETRVLKLLSIVHGSFCENVPPEFLTPATTQSLTSVLSTAVGTYVNQNLPECIFWRYGEEQLVPAQLAMEEFTQSPDSCMPLKHVFALAGIVDIAAAVRAAKSRSNGIRNLLDRVAKQATEHIHSVWPEYDGLEFDLRQNGDYLETSIKDVHNLYNFSQRSDGFKRLLSFLLMISAPARSKSLSNVLILTDDPDAGLHPTAARHIRDELTRISASNYVVYATHSIFMIDRDEVSRHLIVTKKNEVTEITMADESNIVDEEVLYNALGYSVFENLKSKNLVFEGWRDKTLFQIAMSRVPRKFFALKKKVSNLGICHVEGVKDVRRVTPMMELANRVCVIVSDADNVAQEHQKIHIDERLYGNWVRYDELVPEFSPVTSEDFVMPQIIADCVTGIAESFEKLAGLSFQPTLGAGQLKELGSWLSKAGLNGDERKQFTGQLKELLFSELKSTHIREEYYEFVSALIDIVDQGLLITPSQDRRH